MPKTNEFDRLTIEGAVASAVRHRHGQIPREDSTGIERLILAYALCIDFGLIDELLELFSPNGVWDGRDFRYSLCQGTAEMRSFFQRVCGPIIRQTHIIYPPYLWRDDQSDSVFGLVPFSAAQATEPHKPNGGPHAYGIYQDHYLRTGGTWRIQSRVLRLRLVRQ
jgi:hypothetical protein